MPDEHALAPAAVGKITQTTSGPVPFSNRVGADSASIVNKKEGALGSSANLTVRKRVGTLGSLSAALVLLAGVPSLATAMPITFFFTGTGSGQLNGIAFSSRPFTFELHADTSQLQTDPLHPLTTFFDVSGFVDIGGVGTDTIAPGLRIFNNRENQIAGLGTT